jgi:predicted HTH domain antitoxin
MQVQIELPEDVAKALLIGGQDLGRTASESVAIEGYRSGKLSEEQVRRLLGFESRFDVHAFLKIHNVYLNYTQEDLDRDLVAARP